MERNPGEDERQYTLQELADSAGVSIRTIRYYIGEGLLPGPDGAGPQSHYTESHAKRLQAIALLKDRFLPLKEIRKQLTGLDDAAVDRLIVDLGGGEQAEDAEFEELLDIGPMSVPAAPAPAPETRYSESAPKYDPRAYDYIENVLSRSSSRFRGVRETRGRERPEPQSASDRWRKIVVADGVELLVREDIYSRRQDRIDWLIDWAKKVVD